MANTVKLQTDHDVIQLVQDRLDAARYRWLREGDNDEKVMSRSGEDWDDVFVLRREKLDAAIDAAMAQESGR